MSYNTYCNGPKLICGPLTLHIKTTATSHKITQKGTFETSMHLTESPKCGDIYRLCLYILVENN